MHGQLRLLDPDQSERRLLQKRGEDAGDPKRPIGLLTGREPALPPPWRRSVTTVDMKELGNQVTADLPDPDVHDVAGDLPERGSELGLPRLAAQAAKHRRPVRAVLVHRSGGVWLLRVA